ncbi:hypothetical protein FHS76_000938 [Ochrobactrum daejeonense]|uniref:Uncharacterized protein n=1 Tax=Brucella daejeonensis TaxID=659015 RepID=A0A7W9AVL9_9HYPH|nr:hypothetical protein [Brucella daejeonensis]MBB5701089.1 hypothetical protein [Brucella daejeonensis]
MNCKRISRLLGSLILTAIMFGALFGGPIALLIIIWERIPQ